jgi:alkanesulfonate monooxygenase SsuD/methylene tetrahydromethanopterin reductase-like flavin-dependent oxidoreductase (luciferase family)
MVLAKMTSVLDVASDGRYHLGIGVGGEFPKEFEACGVPVKQRGSRSNEALEIITKLWSHENQPDYDLRGRYKSDRDGTFDIVALMPTPYPVPTGGPVGEPLRAAKRPPNRPAHIHFIDSTRFKPDL